MKEQTKRMAQRLANNSGDDQTLDDIVAGLCGSGPLVNHSGDQFAAMLLRHLLKAQELSLTPGVGNDTIQTVNGEEAIDTIEEEL